MFDRIEVNPEIMLGQPVIKGTRLPVYVIVEAVAEGNTKEEFIAAYAFLTAEDIQQALRYAAFQVVSIVTTTGYARRITRCGRPCPSLSFCFVCFWGHPGAPPVAA